MSQRRMFSPQIIDSDAFLDMPSAAQALYFHFGMRADDDGFVGNPKKILKMVGGNEDDFKILLAKRFILSFESGIIVIKHWRIHNKIQADRYKETQYIEEKSLLRIKPNKSYTDNLEYPQLLPQSTANKEIPIWQKNRQKVMQESELPYSFNYKIKRAFSGKPCPICGVEMREQEMSKNCKPSIQHNIPISKGGKHQLGNISVICKNCNDKNNYNTTGDLNSNEVAEIWEAIVSNRDTQVRLGKVRLGKVNNIIPDEKKFKIPILEEVKNYCLERNNCVDPERFINFYESKGWLIGRSKMKDWRAAIRIWENNNKKQTKEPINLDNI